MQCLRHSPNPTLGSNCAISRWSVLRCIGFVAELNSCVRRTSFSMDDSVGRRTRAGQYLCPAGLQKYAIPSLRGGAPRNVAVSLERGCRENPIFNEFMRRVRIALAPVGFFGVAPPHVRCRCPQGIRAASPPVHTLSQVAKGHHTGARIPVPGEVEEILLKHRRLRMPASWPCRVHACVVLKAPAQSLDVRMVMNSALRRHRDRQAIHYHPLSPATVQRRRGL